MDVSFLSVKTGDAASDAPLTAHDLTVLVVIPIVVAIVAPLVLQGIGMINDSLRRSRQQKQLVSGIEDEIRRIENQNKVLLELLEMDVGNGKFRQRMEDDPRYFIYIAEGEPSQQVFDTKTKDFSFIKRECFNLLIEYYDTQSLIFISMSNLRSDLFRELSTVRKLDVISNIIALFKENTLIYRTITTELQNQLKPYRPWLNKP